MTIHDLGTIDANNHSQRFLAHLEKSGPAFSSLIPVGVVQQLEASLVAQTCRAAGDVLNALQRHCLLDVCEAWTRLIRIANVTPNTTERVVRERWFWQDALEFVTMALSYAETDTASLKWAMADSYLRQYAREAADAADQKQIMWQGSEDVTQILRQNAATYRRFAEGK